LWTLIACASPVGGGCGWLVYRLIVGHALSSQHSGPFKVLAIVVLVTIILVILVVLAFLVAWLWLFWRAGNRSIEMIESANDARETFTMLSTLLLQCLRLTREQHRSSDDGGAGEGASG
jgi:Kef-type K+ transport system membrane component KefB